MLGLWSAKRLCSKLLRYSRLSNVYEERPQARISSSSIRYLRQKNGDTKFSHTLSHNRRLSDPSPRGKTVSTQETVDLPPLPGQRKPKEDNIIPSDLYATIQSHRDANRAAMIRKRVVDIPDEHLLNDAGSFFRSIEVDTPQVLSMTEALPEKSNWRYKRIGRPNSSQPRQSTNSKTGFPLPWRLLGKVEVNLDSGERSA